jgi:hypothetical protein
VRAVIQAQRADEPRDHTGQADSDDAAALAVGQRMSALVGGPRTAQASWDRTPAAAAGFASFGSLASDPTAAEALFYANCTSLGAGWGWKAGLATSH